MSKTYNLKIVAEKRMF